MIWLVFNVSFVFVNVLEIFIFGSILIGFIKFVNFRFMEEEFLNLFIFVCFFYVIVDDWGF